MLVKDQRVSTYRVPTFRDVEDWRKEPAEKRQGPWAVHCLEHGQRTFSPTYADAKEHSTLPESCPLCKAFDQRCIYCPSDLNEWARTRNSGFTPSVGHITGNAVCIHHKYGPIPDDINYEESQDPAGKTYIEIFFEFAGTRNKAVTIAFRPVEHTYCLLLNYPSDYVTRNQAATYSRALNFALSVATSLQAKHEIDAGATDYFLTSLHFESWEGAAAPKARVK